MESRDSLVVFFVCDAVGLMAPLQLSLVEAAAPVLVVQAAERCVPERRLVSFDSLWSLSLLSVLSFQFNSAAFD